jgi:hypothetical protein
MGAEFSIHLIILSDKPDDLDLFYKFFTPIIEPGYVDSGNNWIEFNGIKSGWAKLVDKKVKEISEVFKERDDVVIVHIVFCDELLFSGVDIIKKGKTLELVGTEMGWDYYNEDGEIVDAKYKDINILDREVNKSIHKFLKNIKK